ncbi:MAG: hypothetical protein HPY64_13615 [Anaerolineae bacterium]|nr:hypothetical protein [Anaerolineae bacterium]
MFLLRERRLLHTVLLVIILATLPCYCAGAMLLGLAPDRSRTRLTPTQPLATAPAVLTVIGPTATASLFPTITPLPPIWATPTPLIGGTLATPGQYVPPRPTFTPWPTATPWPTWTLPPTATISIPTSTPAPTVTFTFTWTPPPSPTDTPVVVPPSETPVLPPTNTEPPPPTPTPEVLDSTG